MDLVEVDLASGQVQAEYDPEKAQPADLRGGGPIFLSHGHFDHASDVGEIVDERQVVCGSATIRRPAKSGSDARSEAARSAASASSRPFWPTITMVKLEATGPGVPGRMPHYRNTAAAAEGGGGPAPPSTPAVPRRRSGGFGTGDALKAPLLPQGGGGGSA